MKYKLIILLCLFKYSSFAQFHIYQQGDSIFSQSLIRQKVFKGTDFSTVVQSTIDYLTPKGATGSGGGRIVIASGSYHASNEIVITGWEQNINPYSQLIIEGEGLSTSIAQNTKGKNAFVVKNAACFVLQNLRVYTGISALSGLLLDDTGFNEQSCSKSIIQNVDITSNSPYAPALYLKNFFDLTVSALHVSNNRNSAIVIENNSNTTNYGNSHFNFVRASSADVHPYGGLVIRSTNRNKFVNMLTFNNYECISGYYGIYSTCLKFSVFNFVDIEGVFRPIVFDGAGGNETRDVRIVSGYLLPKSGGVAISSSAYTSGNSITIHLEADSSVVPLRDEQQYRIGNTYELTCGLNVDLSKATVLDRKKTKLTIRRQEH